MSIHQLVDQGELVVIAVECHDGGPARTCMRRIPNASTDVLTDFVLDDVARGSEVRSDAWLAVVLEANRVERILPRQRLSLPELPGAHADDLPQRRRSARPYARGPAP